ncbi:uncharacterized protein BJX67DRAFT_377205 [Aspergillus lucknowensis]|uniref:Uncharacterized protein n=1 Tax=Aspergillus lucknowensis TaxID=176173 RepID=A0ABR4M4C5_9EURO
MTSRGSAQSQSRGAIQCDLCQATFSRQEHLSRHTRSHTTERPFQCRKCGKRFARHDVLQRHRQSHAIKPFESLDGRTGRACKECALCRVRCSRGNPCERCIQRGIQCIYPQTRRRKEQQQPPAPRGNGSRPRATNRGDSDHSPVRPPATTTTTTAITTTNPNPDTPQVDMRRHELEQPGLEPFNVLPATADSINGVGWFPRGSNSALGMDSDGMMAGSGLALDGQILENDFSDLIQSMPSVNWLSPQGPELLFQEGQLDASLLTELNSAAVDTERALWGFDRAQYAPICNGLDPGTISNRLQEAPRSHPTPMGSLPSESGQSVVESPMSLSTEGTYYVDGSAGRAPFHGRSGWRPSKRSHGGVESGMPTTGEGTANPGEHGHSEPLLSDTSYEGCVQSLLIECETLGINQDIVPLPSLSDMQTLVQLYFNGLHATYPFLLKHPTLFTQPSAWILLWAVAVIGSRFANTAGYHRLGAALADVLGCALGARVDRFQSGEEGALWLPGTGNTGSSPLDLVTLQAALLYNLSLLHSVEAAKSLDVVSGPEISSVQAEGLAGPESVFERWLVREARIRTGWMIWLLDSVCIYQFNCSPLFQLGDIKAPLPCHEDFWHASPGFVPQSERGHNQVTLLDALEMLYMEKKLPPNLGDLSTIILIFAICRRTREATMQHQTELTFWSPNAKISPRASPRRAGETWPPILSSLSKWRNSACDCLDILHWNANGRASRAGGWEHPAIFHLHIARLILLAPIQHIQQLAMSAGTSPPGPISGPPKYMTGYNHVLRWAALDQYKARLSVIHAGALLWHVRRYSSNNFLEPFGIYAASLVIWAYSISTQVIRGKSLPENIVLDAQSPLQGDTAPAPEPPSTDQQEILESEDSDGQAELPVIQLDRPCDDEIVQAYVRFGHRMSARMHRVGDICSPGASQRILKKGIRLLASSRNPVDSDDSQILPSWEIEKSYSQCLQALSSNPLLTQDH